MRLKDRSEENIKNKIKDTISKTIGPIAKPDKIQIVLDYLKPDQERSCEGYSEKFRLGNLTH